MEVEWDDFPSGYSAGEQPGPGVYVRDCCDGPEDRVELTSDTDVLPLCATCGSQATYIRLYQVSESPGRSIFICVNCGSTVRLASRTDVLPPCSECEEDEATRTEYFLAALSPPPPLTPSRSPRSCVVALDTSERLS